jgi:hypothetical protein
MNSLDAARRLTEAHATKDKQELELALHADATLEGPFPIGSKKGREKVAKKLAQVAKLGATMMPPVEANGALTSAVNSPAGQMVVFFTVTEDLVSAIEVRPPS